MNKESPRAELLRLGVSNRQAEYLLSHHDLAVIRQQLKWLPLRNPVNPARLITIAIKQNYGPPSLTENSNDDFNNSDPRNSNSSDFLGDQL